MGSKKEIGRAANGLYFRNLGWKKTPNGYAQQKFYLGRDESKAKLANLRLEQLWQQVARRWEREIGLPPAKEKDRRVAEPISSQDTPSPGRTAPPIAQGGLVSIGISHAAIWGDRPAWDETTLAIDVQLLRLL